MRVTSKFLGYPRQESFPWPKRREILAGNLPSCVFSAGSILREGKPFPQIRLGVTYSRVNLRDILTT